MTMEGSDMIGRPKPSRNFVKRISTINTSETQKKKPVRKKLGRRNLEEKSEKKKIERRNSEEETRKEKLGRRNLEENPRRRNSKKKPRKETPNKKYRTRNT
jgi:hypothetical protein